MTTTMTLARPRGFALNAASQFYAGFIPGSGMAAAAPSRLTLAFRLDKSFEAVVVALREEGDSLIAECVGTRDEETVSKQVARMLGLDVEGDAWRAVGARDPIVGKLQAEFPGFFTAAKPSPYDAAAWAVIAPRLAMSVAAKIKIGIAGKHGDLVRLGGEVHAVFPSPEQVLRIDHYAGLSDEKLARLKGIAWAAIEGKLDADRLCAISEDDALAELQTLRGVGPWAAAHILYRGAAVPDALPTGEPRVLHGLAAAYGIESPSVETFAQLAEVWRPLRMWVCVLLARHLARAGGWHAPGLARERAEAGKRLRKRTARQQPRG